MDFLQASNQYQHLKQAYQAGEITADAFEKQINSMVIYYEDQKWMLGVNTGKWYRHDGTRWVEDTPPISVPQPSGSAEVSDVTPSLPAQPQTIPPVAIPPAVETKTSRPPRWVWAAALLALLAVAFIAFAGLVLTGLIKPPAPIAALLSSPTPSATFTPQNSPTPTKPPSTPTPSPIPINVSQVILGSWHNPAENAMLNFYPDSSFVFFDPFNKNIEAGRYSFLSNSLIQFETLLGEEITQHRQVDINFTDKNSFTVTVANGALAEWQRSTEPVAASRHEDPLAVLNELAFRMGWGTPDPDCAFDRNDEVSTYRYLCLDLEETTALTWVDQSPSNGTDRDMERSMLTISIYHNRQPAYQTALEQIKAEMTPAELFHQQEAYSSQSDLGWFTFEKFAWLNDPWLFSIQRVNSLESPATAPGLQLAAEIVIEILEGQPPQSSPATIPSPIPEGGSIYAKIVIGTWEQHYTSKETIEFYENGTMRVFSTDEKYDYTGHYMFEDDQHITFNLNVGQVKALINIEGDVMTLTINGIAAIYYRVEPVQQ